MSFPKGSSQRYSEEEKKQLIANLNHEVEHRSRQFRAWLQDRLEAFNIHQEGKILRIPKEVRSMSMREFAQYNGDIQAARRGVQRERINSAEQDPNIQELERKRKRIPSQEDDLDNVAESSRSTKNARLMDVSPKKAGSSTGPGTAQRGRLMSGTLKTPGKNRVSSRTGASSSPQKPRPPFNSGTSLQSKPLPRPLSPSKQPSSKQSMSRVPSSSTFNPTLPPKTPGYPGIVRPPSSNGNNTLRLPRINESMLSVNGSPLANPLEFGIKWSKSADDVTEPIAPTLKRVRSNITISRDPSFTQLPSRPISRASSSQPEPPESRSSSQPEPQRPFETPRQQTRSYSVTISTKDGHLLEFDPLQTSPAALEALEGITSSAKKQAREDMGRLVRAASEKWKID